MKISVSLANLLVQIYQYHQKYRLEEYIFINIGIGWTHIGPTLLAWCGLWWVVLSEPGEFSFLDFWIVRGDFQPLYLKLKPRCQWDCSGLNLCTLHLEPLLVRCPRLDRIRFGLQAYKFHVHKYLLYFS